MPRGRWSFLHEWVIYDYLMARFAEGTLRLRCRVLNGVLQRKDKWSKVADLRPIVDSLFPDVKGMRLAGSSEIRPAEIKFITSLFDYHQRISHLAQYRTFVANSGLILVLSHDYLPQGLGSIHTDVYEIDFADFVSFCRENFSRLLSRQIKTHAESKVWIMYQGPNFNKGCPTLRPARESNIWCPTENLTGFDLAVGDRILFVKTSGSSTQIVQGQYLSGTSFVNWQLDEIFVGEISSAIYSRAEYCHLKGIPFTQQLWRNDPQTESNWRWNRVFEFKQSKTIRKNLNLEDLRCNVLTRGFFEAVVQVFCFGKSREISMKEYLSLLEQIT
jgi:hypothetical protein